MEKISNDDFRLKYSGFYNIYPIRNEISVFSVLANINFANSEDQLIIDNYYGRIFNLENYEKIIPYGNNKNMKYYQSGISGEIVDELRVPYRKVPIFKIDSLDRISVFIKEIENVNPSHDILLRGQTKIYLIPREDDEKMKLYGDTSIKEPSFLPSHLRNNFNEFFMNCMWHDQASILLNDIGAEYFRANKELYIEYVRDAQIIRNSYRFTLFSLSLAQHYGMPSIGLDLTKKVDVAAWFATHTMNIDKNGLATVNKLDNFQESTIFVFRCPKNAIFPYTKIHPIPFPEGRPDRQDAWFGHVGWGCAKNQLGSYLACGFRLSEQVIDEFPKNYENYLFPTIEEDHILKYFIKIQNKNNYIGEAKRALQKVYRLNYVPQ